MPANTSTESNLSREKKVTSMEVHQEMSRRSERSNAFMQQLRLRIANLLQTTLSSEQIVHYFFVETQAAVAMDGMTYKHPVCGATHTEGNEGTHRATYRLSTNDEHFGEIHFSRNKRFNESELHKLESLLDLFIYPIRNALRYQEALRAALTDPLTGVGNRLSLTNDLKREIEICRRYDRKLSALLLDIDKFKNINDLFGHAVGDQVLKSVTTILKQSLRDADSVYRLGGEEFLVLMTDTTINDALVIAERIRQNISQCEIGAGSRCDVTVSLGAAELTHDMSADQLIQNADKAMYLAKRNGRDQVQKAL